MPRGDRSRDPSGRDIRSCRGRRAVTARRVRYGDCRGSPSVG